jgi:hypothetical protein
MLGELYITFTTWGCSSLGRAVGSQSAGTGIETPLLHTSFFVFVLDALIESRMGANGVSVTLKLPKL